MSLAHSLAAVESRITAACTSAGRAREAVRLLAISKTRPASAIAEMASLGQRAFGENYVQEALPKIEQLHSLALEWHHVGPIQSNKTIDIARHFAWAHGVDRLKVAERLSSQRPTHLPPLNICLQVNVSGEASKGGCTPDEALALCWQFKLLPGIKLRGLMALPAPSTADADARAPFRQLRRLLETLRTDGMPLDTLSMGMSDDLEAAIAEGSTMIRIGSALFGAREAGKSHIEPAS
ncbi:MAG: YggS family pyridoxal phosphate-dependent enzyme [Pseudomonadota bacterium]